MKRLPRGLVIAVLLLNLSGLAGGLLLGWSPLGVQFSNNVYDLLFDRIPAVGTAPQSIVLAIDERTLSEGGGMRRLRAILTDALSRMEQWKPSVVAIDSILTDPGDPVEDRAMADQMRRVHSLVLSCDIVPESLQWELPLSSLPRTAVGHVHAEPDRQDAVSREYPLERVAQRARYWALALESLRLHWHAPAIEESPDALQVGDLEIPSHRAEGRTILIRYRDGLPRLSLAALRHDPSLGEQLRGKVVFVGVTAISAARDRLLTPYAGGQQIPGVEIHAQAFETLASRRILTRASSSVVFLACLLVSAVMTALFLTFSGGTVYSAAVALLAIVNLVPAVLLRSDIVFPAAPLLLTVWICALGAGSFEYFVIRRELRRTSDEKSRYQQAIHFVTHEMRTPLTAIQGSSELMGRYNLNEEKRRQMAQMINAESKRLARMITTFLSVERLNDGQLELKTEPVAAPELVTTCIERARPLADRKQIRIEAELDPHTPLTLDRELMEYAVYNLITNAIKYSPAQTLVQVRVERKGDKVQLAVQDQGIGMDAKEVKRIFQKFYRTRKAEESGEAGTGIGLSIVEQIVKRHGGKIEVSSTPGVGSVFTLVLPAGEAASMETAPPLSR